MLFAGASGKLAESFYKFTEWFGKLAEPFYNVPSWNSLTHFEGKKISKWKNKKDLVKQKSDG